MLCINRRCARIYIDPKRVLDVEEAVDVASGLKSAGWDDEFAAVVRVGTDGAVVAVGIRPGEWPAVKRALGLDAAAHVNLPPA